MAKRSSVDDPMSVSKMMSGTPVYSCCVLVGLSLEQDTKKVMAQKKAMTSQPSVFVGLT